MWIGVDGCKLGWFAVTIHDTGWSHAVYPDISTAWASWHNANLVLIDIPIGLVDSGAERTCDRRARQLIGARRSSVFPAPSRAAFRGQTYEESSTLNRNATGRGLSRQSWAILPKIREIDVLLESVPGACSKIREVHPEVLFWALNDGRPLDYPKKRRIGHLERLHILSRHYPETIKLFTHAQDTYLRKHVASDDILDAMAAAVTAYSSHGVLEKLAQSTDIDSTGLPMEMVYWRSRGAASALDVR